MLSAIAFSAKGAPAEQPGAKNEEDEDDAYEEIEEENEDALPPGISVLEREKHTSSKNDVKNAIETEDDNDENVQIQPADYILVATKADENDDHLLLQYVYEPEDDRGPPNIFPHHEVPLAAFPLCAAWVPGSAGTVGTHAVAVGSASEEIEVFDMDVLDSVEPAVALQPSHAGGTMSLAWNAQKQHVLASGGADNRCKLWDVEAGTLQQTLSHHTGKVQACDWSFAEPSVLLTAAFDKSARVVDARAPGSLSLCVANLPADAEDAIWNPAASTEAFVSSEDGTVLKVDARACGKGPLWSIAAHNNTACTALCAPPALPGMLITASYDGSMKVWDGRDGTHPELVLEPAVRIGALFSLSVADQGGAGGCLVAAAGANGEPAVVDLKAFEDITQRWTINAG